MKTFEQVYKEKFKDMLANFVDNKIVVSNDISYKPLEYDADSIVTVIQTGLGQASTRNDYDLINTTFQLTFLLHANNLQMLLAALNSMIWNYNGKWEEIQVPIYVLSLETLQEKTYVYKPVFTTPTQIGGISKMAIEGRTINVVTVVMNIAVAYSSNADLKPDDFRLFVDGAPYAIFPIEYSITSMPSYDTSLSFNDFANQELLNETVVFVFTLQKRTGAVGTLANMLTADFFTNSSFFSNKPIKLRKYSNLTTFVEVDIKSISIEEIYSSGTKLINLTLTR